ncbi:MAG: hypothetical protein AB1689_07950, partial [Thermodesulfobacteriota bacterium]
GAPLAAWRLRAVAAEVCDARRRRADAREHRASAGALLRRLAGSLDADDPLQASLLAAAPVRDLVGAARERSRVRPDFA